MLITFVTCAIVAATLSAPPQHSNMTHAAQVMGFDQHTTTHVFAATAEGGSIAVDVKDPADIQTRDQIRAHLTQIARAFAKGDFSKPFQTHAEEPPGVPVMIEKRDAIAYTYSDTPGGGIVRIRTTNTQALEA